MKYLSRLLPVVVALLIVACDQPSEEEKAMGGTIPADYYLEDYRPQFHFSPEANWMNDPNGLVYYQGEYHMFYQYYPDSTVWGPMHWGHAVSRDLVTWEHLPVALYPDDLGYIFSGSVVVDRNNTSGLGTDENPPLVAIYTYHQPDIEASGASAFQYQGLAYSVDKGRTWTKYEGNPILKDMSKKDFRDPRVVWHAPSQKWVMILAVFDHLELYGSPDLISWQYLSSFGQGEGSHEGVWECPDLFELPLEGTAASRWVMLVSISAGGERGSATQYFVGDFDGTAFVNQNRPENILWLDFGRDNYAGVTWSDVPERDGRRIFMGWMSNWDYAQVVPTHPWRSAMTVPRTLSLVSLPEGFRIRSFPVGEFDILRKQVKEINKQLIIGGNDWSSYLYGREPLLDMELVFTNVKKHGSWQIALSNLTGDTLVFGFDDVTDYVFVDRSAAGETGFSDTYTGVHRGKRKSNTDQMAVRVLLDRSSLEIFADMGEVVLTEQFFVKEPFTSMRVQFPHDEVLVQGVVYQLNRIWPQGED
ncbi:MAG: glycoside hydrolase family 32 protein [Cyclobacteriaceae bacterium]|nr:glycoside hydrolase family 32 protein [Cyclobacteriaceae bacterium]